MRCGARHLGSLSLLLLLTAPAARAEDATEDQVAAGIKQALEMSDPNRIFKGITWTGWREDTQFDYGDFNSVSTLLQTPGWEIWGNASFVGADPSCQDSAHCDESLHLRKCTMGGSECAGTGGTCQLMPAAVSIPGRQAPYLCAGEADQMLNSLHKLITSANSAVDIASLTAPDGRFRDMLRNALTYLARSNRPVTVRILIGDYLLARLNGDFDRLDVTQLLADVVTSANASTNQLRVFAGRMRVTSLSEDPGWPHAKIVAVDGREAIVGGENLWTDTYLGTNPVWDVNLRYKGQVAGDATRFLDESWKYLCDNTGSLERASVRYVRSYHASHNQPGSLKLGTECLKTLAIPSFFGTGNVKAMGVGKLGLLDMDGDQSLVAQAALIRAARDSVYLSQQGLKGPALLGFPTKIMKALADQLVNRRHVYIVQSGDGAGKGSTEPYSSGTLEDLARKMKSFVKDALDQEGDSSNPDDLLCKYFHLAPFRFNATSANYANTNPQEPIPNHAKFILVDHTAFYVGSHNLYPSGNNMEYGVIIDDTHVTTLIARKYYWDPLWKYAKLSAISGDDAPKCTYR